MTSSTLPVVETFHSIQGEGSHTGRSAFFIRLASCKVQCPWCDTKNSWSIKSHPELSIESLCQEVKKAVFAGAAFVVITGGEPLHHDLNLLCQAIKENTIAANSKPIPIHLETSGVDRLSGDYDWITLSPKRHFPPTKELLALCQELKVIINDVDDLSFAEEMQQATLDARKNYIYSKGKHKMPIDEPLLFMQPGWQSSEGSMLAYKHVQNHPTWRLSVQTHKWLGLR